MRDYFLDLDLAARDPNRRVAWCTSVGPAEILRAMGFEVFFPENHGAMLGATRLCMETLTRAHAMGFSPDICSYLTSDIGAYRAKVTPLTRAYGIESVPRPDVLVYNTNQCKDVMHWFEFFGREFNAPVVGIHGPTQIPEVLTHHVADVVAQFEALITQLESIAAKALDRDELARVCGLSRAASDLWSGVLATAKARPSPFNFFDTTIYMGPMVVLRGTQKARDYYRELLAEMKTRVAQGVAAVEHEDKRIYWEGMPVWGRLRALADLFQRNHACVVASTYCNSWVFDDFDADDPLPSMARAYLRIFINRNDDYKCATIRRLVQDYAIDGVLFHEAKTCPNNSNSQYRLPERLREQGVACATIQGDLCDLRCFSDEQSATIIEAFVETL